MNSEAELAGVIGHEIGHVTAVSRKSNRTVSGSATSREMSLVDRDPSFLDIWFSGHLRTPERILAAASEARATIADSIVNRDGYLRMIDDVAFGESPGEGYIRGGRDVHPEWRFAFEVPEDFVMIRVADEVRALNSSNAVVVFERAEEIHAGMAAHLLDWADELLPAFTYLQGPESLEIAGFEAAAGSSDAHLDGDDARFRLVAVALNPGRIARFLFAAPVDDGAALDGLVNRTIASFRRLSPAEAARTGPLRVRIVEVQPADTVDSLAAEMAFEDSRRERFMVLNGLESQADLEAGILVKLIRSR